MITWTKTETKRMELMVYPDGGHPYHATPADILAAIEADEGLREEVFRYAQKHDRIVFDPALLARGGVIVPSKEWEEMKAKLSAAESDRDAWKQRAERAERDAQETDELCDRAQARMEKAENEAGWLAAWRVELLAKIERIEQERDEARAEVERVKSAAAGSIDAAGQTIKGQDQRIAELTKGLAGARDLLLDSRKPTPQLGWEVVKTADARELQARRKLDEWQRADQFRSVGIAGDLMFAKEEHSEERRRLVTAETYPELARKLGLL